MTIADGGNASSTYTSTLDGGNAGSVFGPELTAYTDAAPCPRVRVNVTDVIAGTVTATLHRVYDERDDTVPGAQRVTAGAGFVATDFYPPLRTPVRYYVEFFTAAGVSLGVSDAEYTQLETPPGESWLTSPFDPSMSLRVEMADNAGESLVPDIVGSVHQIGSRKIALLDSTYGLTQLPMSFWTETIDEARTAMQIFRDGVGLVVYRTPPPMEVPRVLYGWGTPEASETNLPGGVDDFLFSVNVEEVDSPTAAIIAAQRPYRLYVNAFPTYAAFSSAYGTYRAAVIDPPADNG